MKNKDINLKFGDFSQLLMHCLRKKIGTLAHPQGRQRDLYPGEVGQENARFVNNLFIFALINIYFGKKSFKTIRLIKIYMLEIKLSQRIVVKDILSDLNRYKNNMMEFLKINMFTQF